MDLLDAATIMESVKKHLFTIMEHEAAVLGVELEIRTDPQSHRSLSKKQLPRIPDDEMASEKLNDSQLETLTQQNIEDTYKKPWNRLTDKQKLVCIRKFANSLVADCDQIYSLEEFLVAAIIDTKKLKQQHLEYDDQHGCIRGVPRLIFKDGVWKLLAQETEKSKGATEATQRKKKKQPSKFSASGLKIDACNISHMDVLPSFQMPVSHQYVTNLVTVLHDGVADYSRSFCTNEKALKNLFRKCALVATLRVYTATLHRYRVSARPWILNRLDRPWSPRMGQLMLGDLAMLPPDVLLNIRKELQ